MKIKILNTRILTLFFNIVSITVFSQVQVGSTILGQSNGGQFGFSVDISSNGNIIAVGEPTSGQGIVYVYQNISGSWVQLGDVIPGINNGDYFGERVALSSDGLTVAIGAPQNDDGGTSSGHVRIFEYDGNNWAQKGNTLIGDSAGDIFGKGIVLSDDGNTVAIGASSNDGNGYRSGQVKVYQFQSNTWMQIGSSLYGTSTVNGFGFGIDLSSDGSILVASAPANSDVATESGQVRIFQNISNSWVQIGSNLNGTAASDNFGESVSLSSNGNFLAVGAPLSSLGVDVEVGYVKVFENMSGNWTQKGSTIYGIDQFDNTGSIVSLSSDGSLLAVATRFSDLNGVSSGTFRLYSFISNDWVQIGNNVNGDNPNDALGFGMSLSKDGSTIVTSTPFDDTMFSNSGLVKVYDYSSLLTTSNFNTNDEFKIYPNPVNSFLTISTNEKINKVEIYDLKGVLVEKFISNTDTLDLRNLNKGVYFLKLFFDTTVKYEKIIID